MPNSLRVKLSKLRYKGEITQEEYSELIKKLDEYDAEIKGQIIRDVLETVKEQNEIYLDEREKQIKDELLDKVMQKQRTIINDDGVMYKVVFLKDIEEMKAEIEE